jgi:hypothetical protein
MLQTEKHMIFSLLLHHQSYPAGTTVSGIHKYSDLSNRFFSLLHPPADTCRILSAFMEDK